MGRWWHSFQYTYMVLHKILCLFLLGLVSWQMDTRNIYGTFWCEKMDSKLLVTFVILDFVAKHLRLLLSAVWKVVLLSFASIETACRLCRRGRKAVYFVFHFEVSLYVKYQRETSEMMFFLHYNKFPHKICHTTTFFIKFWNCRKRPFYGLHLISAPFCWSCDQNKATSC